MALEAEQLRSSVNFALYSWIFASTMSWPSQSLFIEIIMVIWSIKSISWQWEFLKYIRIIISSSYPEASRHSMYYLLHLLKHQFRQIVAYRILLIPSSAFTSSYLNFRNRLLISIPKTVLTFQHIWQTAVSLLSLIINMVVSLCRQKILNISLLWPDTLCLQFQFQLLPLSMLKQR